MDGRLQRVTPETFDSEAYLAANPDVAQSGYTAEDHYEAHGKHEERFQLFETARFKRLKAS